MQGRLCRQCWASPTAGVRVTTWRGPRLWGSGSFHNVPGDLVDEGCVVRAAAGSAWGDWGSKKAHVSGTQPRSGPLIPMG